MKKNIRIISLVVVLLSPAMADTINDDLTVNGRILINQGTNGSHFGLGALPHSDAMSSIRLNGWSYLAAGAGDYPYWSMNVYQRQDGTWNSFHPTVWGSVIGNYGNSIRFMGTKPNASNATLTEHMQIDSSTGNVEIGDTSNIPVSYRLSIAGPSEMTFPGNPTLLGLYSNDSLGADMGGGIIFGGKFSGDTQTTFAYVGGLKENGVSGNFGGKLVFGTRAHGSGGLDMTKMVIDSIGNVGIGTANPGNKLEVNGTIRSKEVIVESTGWSDFVFDDGYELPSLSAVEQHIEEHGHLPNIPSAAEVESEGLSVGEAQKLMMQKIEELTLYMIDLSKEVQNLKEENLSLKSQLGQ